MEDIISPSTHSHLRKRSFLSAPWKRERIFLSLSLFARARSVSGPFLEINVISGCNVLREENGEGEGYGAEDVSPVIRR